MKNDRITLLLALAAVTITQNGYTEGKALERQDIEEVTTIGELNRYGATKSEIPIIETSRSISIVDEETFRNLGALSLDDTLSYTPGVIGDTFGFSTRGDFPKVRGFDAAEYRDGQQVLFGFYNNTRSDVYFLEQVEVLKGPASVLYGRGTPGGIVNAISKIAGAENKSEIVVDIGNHSRRQIAADGNIKLANNLYGRTVALYRDSDTQVDHVNDDAIGIMPSITYDNGKTTITGFVEYMDRESDSAHQFLPLNATGCLDNDIRISPAALCITRNTRELDASTYLGNTNFNRYDSNSILTSVLGSHIINDRTSIEAVIRYKDASVDYNQAWVDFTSTGGPRIDADGNGQRTYYLTQADSKQLASDIRLRWSIDTGALGHEIILGAAYQDVETDTDLTFLAVQDSINVQNPVSASPIPAPFMTGEPAFDAPENTFEDYGVYINDQISINNWKINVGMRYDDVRASTQSTDNQKDTELSSSIGVLYAFDNGLSPYISYSESFEPVLGTTGGEQPETLKPKEGELKEIGIKYQPESSASYFTFAYFEIEENNRTTTGPGQTVIQTIGFGQVDGFEAEFITKFSDVHIRANLTLIDTEDNDGFPFESIPEEQFSTWLGYEPSSALLRGFRSGFGVRYIGESESNIGNVANITTGDYTLFDAMLGYKKNNWDISLNVRNATNERYYSTCLVRGDCYPGEERSVVMRTAYQF